MGKTNETAGPDPPSRSPCQRMQAKHPVIGGVQLQFIEEFNLADFALIPCPRRDDGVGLCAAPKVNYAETLMVSYGSEALERAGLMIRDKTWCKAQIS
jgi:hypothetical protein